MTLRADHLVYRVVVVDPYLVHDDENPCTWKVAVVSVKSATSKRIALKSFFPGLYRTKFTPDALGSAFFETPLQALQYFLKLSRSEIEAIERLRVEAERAIAWATSQAGMS